MNRIPSKSRKIKSHTVKRLNGNDICNPATPTSDTCESGMPSEDECPGGSVAHDICNPGVAGSDIPE